MLLMSNVLTFYVTDVCTVRLIYWLVCLECELFVVLYCIVKVATHFLSTSHAIDVEGTRPVGDFATVSLQCFNTWLVKRWQLVCGKRAICWKRFSSRTCG